MPHPLDNPHVGPCFGDVVTGRGWRPPMTDSRGGRYVRLPNGRERRNGARTKGGRGKA